MADTQETIADIIAEMRDEGHTGESSCLEWVGTKMRYYADRLEAAHKRERGDCAKLREALKECLLYIACAESGTIILNGKLKLDPEKISKSARKVLAATEGGAK